MSRNAWWLRWKQGMINAPAHDLEVVKQILRRYFPGAEARVFGSRAGGNAKPYSDLDIVIVGAAKLDARALAGAKEEFEESDIPFRVDVLDWHRISEEFRQIIARHYEVLW